MATQCLTPLDPERTFGMTRGDICHGRVEADQLFSLRPHPQAAQYATPLPGPYLCGSGTHPWGGVTFMISGRSCYACRHRCSRSARGRLPPGNGRQRWKAGAQN